MNKQPPPLTPILQRAMQRSREHDQGQLALRQFVGQLDQISMAQRQLMPGVAQALSLIQGHPVVVTGLETDNQSGLLVAIRFVSMPSGEPGIIRIEREKPPGSPIVRPN